jgi:hypothetical protein
MPSSKLLYIAVLVHIAATAQVHVIEQVVQPSTEVSRDRPGAYTGLAIHGDSGAALQGGLDAEEGDAFLPTDEKLTKDPPNPAVAVSGALKTPPKAVSKFANFTHDGHTAHKVDPSLMPPVRYGTKWLAPLFGSSGAIYMMLGAALVTVLPLTVVAAKRTMDHSNMKRLFEQPGPSYYSEAV